MWFWRTALKSVRLKKKKKKKKKLDEYIKNKIKKEMKKLNVEDFERGSKLNIFSQNQPWVHSEIQ